MDEKGRPYPGLKPENFSAWVDKVPRNIISLTVDSRPASVALLIDVSSSIGPTGKKQFKEFSQRVEDQVLRFLDISNPENEYFAVVFDGRVAMSERWIGPDRAVFQKLSAPGDHLGTALYDALYYGIQNVMNGRHSRRVIVLISDGQDNKSKRMFNELLALLKRSEVTLYAIALIDQEGWGSALGQEGIGVLDELAGMTGGRAYVLPQKSKPELLKEAFDVIAAELQNQYRLSIEKPVVAGPEKYRKLKVKIGPVEKQSKLPKLYLRTREGYYQ